MGKVRKHKQKPARVDPVGLDSAIAELQHGMDQVGGLLNCQNSLKYMWRDVQPKKNKFCPTLLMNHVFQEELANGKEGGAVETMMAQLQSVNIEDKGCGCHALTRH